MHRDRPKILNRDGQLRPRALIDIAALVTGGPLGLLVADQLYTTFGTLVDPAASPLMLAILGAVTGKKYAWQQAQDNGDGTFSVLAGGATDAGGQLPFYERTGNLTVAAGTVVEGELAVTGDHYLFGAGGGAAPIFGQITAANPPNGSGHVPFSWVQVGAIGNGNHAAVPGGIVGSATKNPAYEWNDLDPQLPMGTHLLVNYIVEMTPDGNGGYMFLAPLIHGLWLSATCDITNDGMMSGVTT